MDRKELIQQFKNLTEEQYVRWLLNGPDYGLAKSFIHTHTDMGSPLDAVLTISQYIETAMDMGCDAIAITDHGTMYAVPELHEELSAIKEGAPKLLVGCEFYVCENVEDTSGKKKVRLHLCAYAKDDIGYHTIAGLVTASNTRIIHVGEKNKGQDYPCISKKLLQEFLAPGTEGHGHVVLTSACVGGVLSGVQYTNKAAEKNIAALEKRFTEAETIQDHMSRIAAVTIDLEKKTEILKNGSDEEKASVQNADTIPDLLKQAKQETKNLQRRIDTMTKIKHCPAADFAAYIAELSAMLRDEKESVVSEADMAAFFEREALWYDNLAGHGNWFIELQYHGIPEEKKCMPMLAAVAQKLDLPVVAANDAHMRKKEDADLRQVINALRFNKWNAQNPGDEELYLKTDKELFSWLRKAVTEEMAVKAMLGRKVLSDMCSFRLKKEEHYPEYRGEEIE